MWKIIKMLAGSVGPDEMTHCEPPHLDLYCLPKPLQLATGLEGLRGRGPMLYALLLITLPYWDMTKSSSMYILGYTVWLMDFEFSYIVLAHL